MSPHPTPAPAGRLAAADTLALTEGEYQSIVAHLARAGTRTGADHRAERRIPCHKVGFCTCRFEPVGAEPAQYLVRCRNISRSGIGFLHDAPVEPGTRCLVTPVLTDRNVEPLRGRIARCDHCQGTIHDIGVRFDEPLELVGLPQIDDAA